jgi:hypothetical protein
VIVVRPKAARAALQLTAKSVRNPARLSCSTSCPPCLRFGSTSSVRESCVGSGRDCMAQLIGKSLTCITNDVGKVALQPNKILNSTRFYSNTCWIIMPCILRCRSCRETP